MRHIELMQLTRICEKFELDSMEIDSSITYHENKDHLLSLVPGLLRDQRFQEEYEKYQAILEARSKAGPYHKGALCPNCGESGSGLHMKWVLNWRKKRYEPYFSFAHSVKIDGHYRVKWHYVRKKRALEILQNSWISEQFNIRSMEVNVNE
jgi:hypothetical protein